MIEEGLPEGKYRLEIYECIKSVIKRDLTEAEHKYLSHILKCYANTARTNSTVVQKQEPLTHIYVCDNCKEEVIKIGQKQNKPFSKKAAKTRREINRAIDEKETTQND